MAGLNFDDLVNAAKNAKSNELDNHLKTNYPNNNSLTSYIKKTIIGLTRNIGSDFSPFINGRYAIYMVNGTWYDQYVARVGSTEERYILSKNNRSTKMNSALINEFGVDNVAFPMLATDIDIPEITKEYVNVSTRSQSLSTYQREIVLPEFSISYLENQYLDIFRYHEAWHKSIELYKRGVMGSSASNDRTNSPYFYDVPYMNGIWVVLYDIQYRIRALFYLVGVRPVSLPIKQLIGNRSDSKMTVYNIQYKGVSMYYKTFDADETDLFSDNTNSKLETKFREHILKTSK